MAGTTKPKLGLQRGHVSLQKHDPYWSVLYVQEATALAKVFGDKLLAIDHVGSTAIPGIKAKPIIDILARLDDLELSPQILRRLKSKGYTERIPQAGKSDKRLFVKGPEECRTYHLHINIMNRKTPKEIVFRDRLNADPELAKAYENVKTGLARKYKKDRILYTEGKTVFIESVIKR